MWGLLYDGALRPVARLDANDQVEQVYVYGTRPNVPEYLVEASTGVAYRLVLDHLGSVHMVVNATDGSIAQQVSYDEFGNVLVDTNPGFQPFGFAGGLYDHDTGLVRFGARDYDAVVGRWTAKDPILFDGGQANLYVYVGGDPVNAVDPAGLQSDEGPYHPPTDQKLHCTWVDSCSELSLKLSYLDHTIQSHKDWDTENNTCRHADEISDLERARANCAMIHSFRCAQEKPNWFPDPQPVPPVKPETILPLIILGCVLCPECCALPIIIL